MLAKRKRAPGSSYKYMYQVIFQYVRVVLLSQLNSKQKIKRCFTFMITVVACCNTPPLPFHFRGDLENYKHFLKGGAQKFLLTFRDEISFTYYKLYGNSYQTFLNQLKMCWFWSKELNEVDLFK